VHTCHRVAAIHHCSASCVTKRFVDRCCVFVSSADSPFVDVRNCLMQRKLVSLQFIHNSMSASQKVKQVFHFQLPLREQIKSKHLSLFADPILTVNLTWSQALLTRVTNQTQSTEQHQSKSRAVSWLSISHCGNEYTFCLLFKNVLNFYSIGMNVVWFWLANCMLGSTPFSFYRTGSSGIALVRFVCSIQVSPHILMSH